MSKLLLPFLSLCLAAWIFGGATWISSKFNQSVDLSTWNLQDGSVQFKSPTQFAFQLSDKDIMLDDHQYKMLNDIAEYLNKNTDRHIRLMGLYTADEINNSHAPNLGLGRAESFRYLLVRLGVELEHIEVSSKKVKAHHLNGNGLIDGGVDFTFFESSIAKYGKAFRLNKELQFDEGATEALKEKEIEKYISSTRQYLVDHPEKKLHLTGYRRTVNEKTLTQKRVNFVNKLLIDNGIPANRIMSDFEIFSDLNVDKPISSYVELRIY